MIHRTEVPEHPVIAQMERWGYLRPGWRPGREGIVGPYRVIGGV